MRGAPCFCLKHPEKCDGYTCTECDKEWKKREHEEFIENVKQWSNILKSALLGIGLLLACVLLIMSSY